MQGPDKMPGIPRTTHRFTKGWLIILTTCLVVGLLLAGLAYTQRHQIHQFLQGLREPPVQTVHITPLTLPPATTTTTPAQVTATDWTTYHHDNTRSGFVAKTPDPTGLTNLWKQPLDGAVYAEPLVIGGQLIVVTENDSLYSLNAQTGQIEWHTNVGTPVPLSDLPCGNIDPLGITGTPVYDPQTGLIFAVAEIQGPAHILLGLDVKTGQIKVRRLVDPSAIDPRAYQQRAALALYGGKIYIAFGGLYGDCSNYQGMIVASRTDGTGSLLIYQVPTTRMGGIWAPPGPIVDAQGNLYVSVGNGGAAISGSVAFIPCVDGLREIQLAPGGNLMTGWQASGQVTGSPVIGGNTVYSLNPGGGTLYALNADTGSVRASVPVGTSSRFATPTLLQNTIYVGTMTGIVAVQINT